MPSTKKAPPAPVAASPAAYSGFKKVTIPNAPKRAINSFSREGKFAFSSPTVALWADPGRDRAGWLNLESGEFKELFACKRPDCVVASDEVAVATFNGTMVVYDKVRNKKAIRISAQPNKMDIPKLAIAPDSILSVQALATDKRQIQLWSRSTNTHQATLPPAEVGLTALSSTGDAATKLIDSTVFQLWRAPYQKPVSLDLKSEDVVDVAYSASGGQLAVLLKEEVVLIDAATQSISARFSAPPPAGKKIKTPIRPERLSQSWIYPTDKGQVVMVDFGRGLHLEEVAIELWNANTGKRVALEIVSLDEDHDRGVAEDIAISEFGVILNCELMYRLEP